MLPDHAPTAVTGLDVVGDRTPREDEHVAESRQHLRADLAEPSRGDRLAPRRHPGPRALARAPGLGHDIRVDPRLEVQLQAARLTRDVTHPGQQFGRHHPVRLGSDVEHSVIRRDEQPLGAGQARRERRERRVESLERRRPLRGGHPLGVPGDVQLRNVEVDQPGPCSVQLLRRRRDAILDRLARLEVGAAQHRGRESRVAIPFTADRHRMDAELTGAFEHGRRSLPALRIEAVRPPAGELVDHSIACRVEHGVADHPVLPRTRPRRQRRERGRRRRRDAAVDRRVAVESRRKRAGVPAMRGKALEAETVDKNHDRMGHCRKAQRSAMPPQGLKAIRKNVGKAEPVGFRRR